MKKIGPSIDSWECDTCLVNNKASENKCLACATPKPRVKPFGSKTSPASSLMKKPGGKQPASSNNTTANDLLKKFAPPAGSWNCDTCLVSNNAIDKKCAACQTPKTEQSGPAIAKGNSVAALNAQDANNNSDLVKKFAPVAGSWTCDTCMISNDAGSSTCAACATPKPGVKSSGSQNGLGGGNFKFGAGNSNSLDSKKVKLPFTFGASESSSKDSPISGFKFGEQTPASVQSEAHSKVTYTFGTGSSDSTSSSKGVDISNMAAPANFTFGATISAGKKGLCKL